MKSEPTLREFITYIDNIIKEAFERFGFSRGIYFAIDGTGELLILPVPEDVDDKDLLAEMSRQFFVKMNVVRYVYTSEAWQVLVNKEHKDTVGTIIAKGLVNHPDRIEVLMYSGEDEHTGQLMAHRVITRDKRGKPSLGPLEFQGLIGGHSEGRMIGLLPVRGMMQ